MRGTDTSKHSLRVDHLKKSKFRSSQTFLETDNNDLDTLDEINQKLLAIAIYSNRSSHLASTTSSNHNNYKRTRSRFNGCHMNFVTA